MNILMINGSPRKKGLISQMLGIMREEAEKRGDTVEMVYTNDLTVKPCTGCMACRKKEKCVLAEDDSQRVLKMMQQADAIIMGCTLLLGQYPRADETDVRPSGLWHDARYSTLSRASDERQEVYPHQHMHHSMALEHPIQAVARRHPCHA